ASCDAGVTAPGTSLFTPDGSSTSNDHEPCESRLFATHMTRRPAHGAPTVPSTGPSLPPAATTIVPRRTALSEATEVTLSGVPAPPSDMLITCATGFGNPLIVRGETESSMAIVIAALRHPPTTALTDAASLQTLYDMIRACGATPCIRMSSAVFGRLSSPGANPR